MGSLLASLPPPANVDVALQTTHSVQKPAVFSVPPSYGQRTGWNPQRDADFGGGGSFPEVHKAQYPCGCGRKAASGGEASHVVAVAVSADGHTDYSTLVKQGSNSGRHVAAHHSALVPKIHSLGEAELARPEQEELETTLAATRAVIEARVNGTMAANQPKTLPQRPGAPQFIKYTPARQGPEYNSGASHRVIKMHTVPVDPMEPPKFVHKKVPRGPGSPPVPVMHSPPRPVSAADQADWKVPPCISNWKNAKGYTVPLDKRLAADGRGLADASINDAFASLSEALYVAEGKAREAVETRAKIARELSARDKAKKEEELRQLAVAARSARVGVAPERSAPYAPVPGEALPPPPPLPAGVARPRAAAAMDPHDGADAERLEAQAAPPHESGAEASARRRREEIREERRRERERERRLEARDAHGGKRSKLTRDRERDVSERVALGQAALGASGGRGGEALFDQRLFGQDQGLGDGFGGDDGAYNTYSQPLFVDRGAAGLYAPRRGDAETTGELAAPEHAGGDAQARAFRPDRGFAGTEAPPGAVGGPRVGPVHFEQPPADDLFGLSTFVDEVRRGQK